TNSIGCTSICEIDVEFLGNIRSNNIQVSQIKSPLYMKSYPNPFYADATIEFKTNEHNTNVLIELYALDGPKISTLFDGKIEKDELYKTIIHGENLKAGVYVYKVTTGDQLIYNKIVFIK
ncbi:MAG: T9SS type A sorting domain-containing protein, partial [Saprospiraceae bacterium]|nr:T9SS type A sorting domain-containing protein [Saprospiraceae bacterium]